MSAEPEDSPPPCDVDDPFDGVDDEIRASEEMEKIEHRMLEREALYVAPKQGLVFSDPKAEMRGIEWLWLFPRGKPSNLEGDGGTLKSCIALDFIARGSRGEEGFLGADRERTPIEPFHSIIISAEDEWTDTIKPRLHVAGADFARAHHVAAANREVSGREGKRIVRASFNLSADMPALEDAIRSLRAKVVLFDPLSAFLGKIDARSESNVRDALTPLAEMLERTDCAGIAIRHHGKATDVRAKYKGLDSVAFANAARLVLTTGESGEKGTFALAHAKGNLAAPSPTLLYRPEEVDLGVDSRGLPIKPVRVVWVGLSELSADDIVSHNEPEARGRLEAAIEFLDERLPAGGDPQEAKWLTDEAEKVGISYRTLRRAKRTTGVRNRPSCFGGPQLWYRPAKTGVPS